METAHYSKSAFDAKYENANLQWVIWYITATFVMNRLMPWQGNSFHLLALYEGKATHHQWIILTKYQLNQTSMLPLLLVWTGS